MSDLIERLRRSGYERKLCHEAADRIEALEAALRKARTALQNGVEGGELTHIVRVINAALSGKGE
jgi:hypothetical protein